MIPAGCDERAFDGAVLGKPVWALTDPTHAAEAVAAAQENAVGLLFCRGAETLAAQLEPHGFRSVEDLVTLVAGPPFEDAPSPAIYLATPEDAPAVAQLAARAFHTTRWHLDPQISNEKADLFKARWAENAVLGRAFRVLLTRNEADEVTGFNALMRRDGDLVIDLIAVAPEAQGQGYGRALMQGTFALAKEIGAQRVLVGTQSVNAASLSLYTKMGFHEIERKRTWHMTP